MPKQQTDARSRQLVKRPWDAIVWWEIRRIPYNLLLFLLGAITVVTVQLVGNQFVGPGEDVVEPLMMVFGAVSFGMLANAFYTLGWVTELLWCWGDTRRTEAMRKKVFRAGVGFASAVTLLPAILIPTAWILFGFQHETSPLAMAEHSAMLESLKIENARTDAQTAIAAKDYRLLGVRGFTVEVPGAGTDVSALEQRYGVKVLDGTSDFFRGEEDRRLNENARAYAKRYNDVILESAAPSH